MTATDRDEKGASTSDHATLPPPAADLSDSNLAALARLAFGSAPGLPQAGLSRHLSMLSGDALDLDLGDPEQRRLGDYELIEKLGQGGMGVVYRARQVSLGRDVAVKLLAAGPWASDDFIDRFRREAQSAARLTHPNIVPIFEIGAQDSLNYFSMQLVRGASLAHVLAESGPFAPRTAANLLRTVAEAVDYAHRLGLLHLDLKPANVLLDAEQAPHVADFGLARPLDSCLGVDSDEISGTPSYMAPEQAQLKSHRLSAATDIYGLGAIGFELLTGRPPFLAATPQQTLQRVLRDEPPTPRSVRPELPADLDAIIGRCLCKDPRQRYPTARALADDLGRFLDGRPVVARPLHAGQRLLRWARREPKMALLGSLVLISLGVGLIATASQWQRAEGHARQADANAEMARQTLWDARAEQAWQQVQRGDSFGAARSLASNLSEQEALPGATAQSVLERRRLGALQTLVPRLIDHRQLDAGSSWSTAISRAGTVLAVGVSHAQPERRETVVEWLRGSDLQGVGVAALNDGRGNPASTIRQLAFSSDDRRILATEDWGADKLSPPGLRMHLIDLATSAAVDWPDVAQAMDATYASDGRHALLRNRNGEVQLWRLDPWEPLSAAVAAPVDANWLFAPEHDVLLVAHAQMHTLERWRLPELQQRERIELPSGARLTAWALAADGNTLALADATGGVMLIALHGNQPPRRLGTVGEQRVRALAFSSDGGWLAAANDGGSVRAWDLQRARPLMRGLELGLRVFSLSLDRASGLLIAGTRDGLHLHRLAELGTQPAPAVALADPIRPLDWFGAFAAAADFDSGLMVSADRGGWLRLWRLPRAPKLQARAARQAESGFSFDGRHLVEVRGRQVRVIDAWTEGGVSKWLEFPQIPGFAALSAEAEVLLVSAGSRLHGFNWRNGNELGEPIDLSGAPTRLALSPNQQHALLAVPAAIGDGYREILSLIDLAQWQRVAGPVEVDGWIGTIDFAPDGEHIRIARMDAAIEILRRVDLTALPWVEPEIMSWWATFSHDGRSLLAGSRIDGPPLAIRRWSLPDGRPEALPSAPPFMPMLELPGGAILGVSEAGRGVLSRLLLHPDGRLQGLPRPLVATAGSGLSHSADGGLLAETRAYTTILADTRTGGYAAPPLPTGLAEPDRLVTISLSADGNALAGRSHMGHWVLHPLPPADAPADSLLAHARLLDQHARDAIETPVERPAREALRAADPGPWPPRQLPIAAGDEEMPPRGAGTPTIALDLGAHYNFSLDHILASPNESHLSAEYYAIAPGTQRIGGIDFDIRGGIQFAPGSEAGVAHASLSDATEFASTDTTGPIELASGTYAAVHALLSAQGMGSARELDEPIAYLDLNWHYRDGTSASVAIRNATDLRWHRDGPRRDGRNAAWLMPRSISVVDYSHATLLYSVRVANPHPEREAIALQLQVPHSPGFLPHSALFALTMEPLPGGRLP